jgi:hypothetical protein
MQCGRCAGDVFLLDTSSELDVHLVCAECGMPQSVASKADHDRYRPIAAANGRRAPMRRWTGCTDDQGSHRR